eukprot:COSAG04_NODE_14568_length_563_cov_0.685345_2_plen_84_part_01
MKARRKTLDAKRFLLMLVVATLGSLAFAQNLTFDSALAKADSQPAVVSALAVLETAKADLGRAKIDPMSTKPTLLKAQQSADLA